mgnify:CR=1 FL=1
MLLKNEWNETDTQEVLEASRPLELNLVYNHCIGSTEERYRQDKFGNETQCLVRNMDDVK